MIEYEIPVALEIGKLLPSLSFLRYMAQVIRIQVLTIKIDK